jgi:hypothetical protein
VEGLRGKNPGRYHPTLPKFVYSLLVPPRHVYSVRSSSGQLSKAIEK